MSILVFLIKSISCLTLLLLFYKLVLEQERMHVFKRFYLLAALLLSFIIPSITFTKYIDVVPATNNIVLSEGAVPEISTSENDPSDPKESLVLSSPTPRIERSGNHGLANYWLPLVWSIYTIGAIVFAFKFLRNLWSIQKDIKGNPKTKIGKILHVLLKDSIVPHTFFNYIFLNREKYERQEIPAEVILHERTHAKQIHSLDVLLVEFLQIVFWFNPILYLYKASIKLNHEFLADQAVIEHGASTPKYQEILLAFASSANGQDNQSSLVNAINYSSYSSIKKRFTVMKTQTTKKSILLRSAMLLPLLALLLYGFSTTVQIPQHPKTDSTTAGATEQQLVEYNALAKKFYELPTSNTILARSVPKSRLGEPTNQLQRLNHIYSIMTAEQKANAEPFPMPDFAKPNKSNSTFQEGATNKQIREYNGLAKKYNKMLAKKGNIRIKKQEVERLEQLYAIMTESQREDAEPYPDFPEPPKAPKPPTPPDQSEIEVGNTVRTEPPVPPESKEMEFNERTLTERRVEEIAEQQEKIREQIGMTEKQEAQIRAHAEKMRKQMDLTEEQEAQIRAQADKMAKQAVAMREHSGLMREQQIEIEKQMEEMDRQIEKIIEEQEIIAVKERDNIEENILMPLTPPMPKSPLELLKELKKENLKIIVDGKEVSYEKAEKLFEQKTFSRINVKNESGERTVLRVWTQ
ncbi:MAG: M56 family metallopeptidase [Pricia sp.]